jgi:hypothetical protein
LKKRLWGNEGGELLTNNERKEDRTITIGLKSRGIGNREGTDKVVL